MLSRILAITGCGALFLAGAYLDPLYTLLAWLLGGIPLSSLGLMVIHGLGLRYSQDFQTMHPVKGEEFAYQARIRNTAFLALHDCRLHFVLGMEGMEGSRWDMAIGLGRGEKRVVDLTLACPFRGVYRVGLESIRITDSLGIFSWTIRLAPHTFYVYPRMVPLDLPAGFNTAESILSAGSDRGAELDHARMKGIREYRGGESLRLLLHRRYLETGQPWVRELEPANPPGLRICLDLRREAHPDNRLLELEDRMFTLAFSLLSRGTREGVPVQLVTWIRHWQVDTLLTGPDFDALLARSMQMLYGDNPGMEHWLSEVNPVWQSGGTMSTIVITNRWHGTWLDLLASSGTDLNIWLHEGFLSPALRHSAREEQLRYPGCIRIFGQEGEGTV